MRLARRTSPKRAAKLAIGKSLKEEKKGKRNECRDALRPPQGKGHQWNGVDGARSRGPLPESALLTLRSVVIHAKKVTDQRGGGSCIYTPRFA